jgi:hypothetical protein
MVAKMRRRFLVIIKFSEFVVAVNREQAIDIAREFISHTIDDSEISYEVRESED